MIQIEQFRARSLDTDFIELSWKIESTRLDVLNYTFQVLRSEAEAGPFEPVGNPFRDRYVFVDNTIRQGHAWRTYFYVLRVTDQQTALFYDTPVVSMEPEPDLIAVELRRHIQFVMMEHAGRRCWVLPIRTFGQLCSCYNEVLDQKRRSNCKTCFDQNYVRGFLSPIESWIQFDPSTKATQNQNTGSVQEANTTARMGYFPMVKPRDVIVEGENRRWRVVAVNQTEHGRARVHQELTLHEIPKTDIEYAVPLDLGVALRDVQFTPSRNFSNPTSMENVGAQDDMPPIHQLYPSLYPRLKS